MPHTQQEPIETLELKVTKFHLQIAGTIITMLLGAVVWFLADAAGELKTLTKTVTEFATYQKTNDLELSQLKKDFAEHKQTCLTNQDKNEALHQDYSERLIKIEAKL